MFVTAAVCEGAAVAHLSHSAEQLEVTFTSISSSMTVELLQIASLEGYGLRTLYCGVIAGPGDCQAAGVRTLYYWFCFYSARTSGFSLSRLDFENFCLSAFVVDIVPRVVF